MKLMKKLSGLAAAIILLSATAFAGTGEGVRAWMASDAAVPLKDGKPFTVTIVLDLQSGWHSYWQYPGYSGLPPKVTWQLPEGWTAGPLEFSVPHQFSEPGDMIIYGYERQQLLRATITPPKDLPKDQIFSLKASLSWLACKELCVPGSADVELKVPGPIWATDLDWASATVPKGDWPLVVKPPFQVSVSGKNGTKLLSFTGENGIGYDFYPDPAEGTTAGHVTQIASGNAIVFSIPWDGSAPFKGLLVEKVSRKAWWIGEGLRSVSATAPPHSGIALGVLLATLFSGFLGGMILNLMPCVLPVISLKIFSFIAQAGESPARIFRHGLAFAAGIFAWFLGLGVLVIALKAGGSQVTWGAFQFQNPWFVVGLSILVFLFALNLFGVFEITLPGSVATSLDHEASRGGYGGSFFQGLFATLLATPCTAPFLGSALGFAFGQSASVIIAMFVSVALGMSIPYLLLSARPGWRKWIPKPGIWMERFKQFMGFPLLATNLWLLWVFQNQQGNDAALALLSLLFLFGFAAWVYGAVRESGDRVFVSVILLLTVSLSVGLEILLPKMRRKSPEVENPSSPTGIQWIPFSPAALDALRAEGKPVFLDFTASWCLTCQFNERTAINVPAVRSLLREKGITAMKGDWTNSDPAITAALKSFGRVGVPLAVYYPPGKGSDPIVLPELLTEKTVIEALRK
jgi:thiol:disulfide interchange protein/DsbC/DsbD-like thiol-disulfide interchange protein